MKLESSVFEEGGVIPPQYSYTLGKQCSGENLSPPLSWSYPPADTQSFGLTVVDPDGKDWVHWLVFNIPRSETGLVEHLAGPPVGISGKNSFGELGWGGPCPPSGTHHYVFTLYALDTSLGLEEGASLKEVQSAMQGHILAQATLTGLFSK
jgi:Raf kinase inhibitor-like YbhB/YbcL family protein